MKPTKFLSIIVVTLLVASSLISCIEKTKEQVTPKPTIFDATTMKKIIEEKSNQFTEAHITRDTAFLNNIFAKDARAYPPNSDVVTGRAAIAAVNAEWVNYGIKEFTEVSTSFYGNEAYLIDEGKYYLRFGEDDIIDKGNYINIWKKDNGDWKIYSNIWNSSLPLAIAE